MVGKDCVIGPNVVIGPGCVVDDGVRLVRTTLLANTRAEKHCMIKSSIIGWKSTIGKWAHLDSLAVLGENVQIDPELCVLGGIILPHKGIKSNITAPGTIVM